jgi:hypothetical protein
MRTIAVTVFGLMLAVTLAVPASAGENGGSYPEIVIPGQPDHGIFDPSIASDSTGKLYMSLSGVASTVPGGNFNDNAVRTYLASSGDQGKSWRLLGIVNPELPVKLGQDHRGIWHSEVSTLAFDPYAAKQARWKLVWHQYLSIGGDRKFGHGWMAYKEAATPEELAAARPVKLFAGQGYDKNNNSPAGGTHTPVSGPPVIQVHKLAPALEHCIFLSEAGMLAKPDALYMSMVCYKPKLLGLLGAYHHIILLKCARPCEATQPGAWAYAGTLLTPDDADDMDLNKFSASDLFSEGGRDYLTVSPVGSKPVPDAYKGCIVFRIADLAKGRLERGANRRPIPVASVNVGKDSFNGACTFLPAGPGKGLLIGRVEFIKSAGGPDAIFHIFRSNAAP